LPRILSRAPSTVSPSSADPSTAATTSPGRSPAACAGEPSIGAMITRRHSGPSVAQSLVCPALSTVPISAPMPSNWPEMPWSEFRKSSGLRYEEYGSSSASIIPLIAPWITLALSTSPPA
jgi:hypothetical protein